MRARLFAFLIVLILAPVYVPAWQDEIPSQPKSDGKVCVAIVSNASTTSAFVERMTARLTKSLKENKINALMMDSRTTTGRQLQPTIENGHERVTKSATIHCSPKLWILESIRSIRTALRYPLADEFPASTRVILVPCPARTSKSALRCFASAALNRFSIRS